MKTLTDEQRISIVKYRIENAHSTLAEVQSHIKNGYYNTAVNRMYYACYYAACAILIAYGIETKSHDGVRQKIGQNLVLTGKLSPELGRFYSRLFSKRSTGDYDDFFNHTFASTQDLLPQTQQFVNAIHQLVENWLLNSQQ